jgi:hypothetical protein
MTEDNPIENDDDLIEFVTEFRAGILDGRPSNMRCAMVCWPLATLLCMVGVECQTVESDLESDLGEMNHFWLRLADGRALDPTIDQFNNLFNENWPPVYLGPPTKYHALPAPADGNST